MARKANMWAKAAGEYYRKNKGKNGIESFMDVLESSDFKRQYHAKHGKTVGKKTTGKRSTRRYRGGDGESPSEMNASQPPATAPQPPLNNTIDGGEPVPLNTPSSISAAELPPPPVTGGKRRNKRRSSNKRR
jgi:hypothetical protein